MKFFTTSYLFATALAAAIDTSALDAPQNRAHTLSKKSLPNTTGVNNGYYYSVYAESTVTGNYTNGPAGEYTLNWGGQGNVVAGKGWNPGGPRSVTYNGSLKPSGNYYLSVYGWTTNPLVEYYINEDFGVYDPSTGGTHKGNVTSDGSVYDIWEQTRTSAPSIEGTQTFKQYWSIRRSKRTNGTVTTGNHFKAWKAAGLQLGTFNYMIVATEGYSSSGYSQLTVS